MFPRRNVCCERLSCTLYFGNVTFASLSVKILSMVRLTPVWWNCRTYFFVNILQLFHPSGSCAVRIFQSRVIFVTPHVLTCVILPAGNIITVSSNGWQMLLFGSKWLTKCRLFQPLHVIQQNYTFWHNWGKHVIVLYWSSAGNDVMDHYYWLNFKEWVLSWKSCVIWVVHNRLKRQFSTSFLLHTLMASIFIIMCRLIKCLNEYMMLLTFLSLRLSSKQDTYC